MDLKRFILAQEKVYSQVISELKNGKKLSHWIWYIFPQIKGLGQSPTAVFYSIQSIDEAKLYLENDTLRERLLECCQILIGLKFKTATEILGGIDSMKLRSSMTLFNFVKPENDIFKQVLEIYFNGEKDATSLRILSTLN